MVPNDFRKVHLELAREQNHPEGDRRHGYDLLLPLTPDGRIDPRSWKKHAHETRVRRFHPGEPEQVGRLGRRPGGSWFFDYAQGGDDDESGFRFGDEAFVSGEYVSVREQDGHMHTFRVVSVDVP